MPNVVINPGKSTGWSAGEAGAVQVQNNANADGKYDLTFDGKETTRNFIGAGRTSGFSLGNNQSAKVKNVGTVALTFTW